MYLYHLLFVANLSFSNSITCFFSVLFFFLLHIHYLNKLSNKKITKKSANTMHLSLDPVVSLDKSIINLRCNQLFSMCVCIDVCIFILYGFISF